MSNKEEVCKMLDKAGIEFEENEDDSSSIVTESGIEFVFKKNGSLKSVSSIASIETVDKHNSWQYYTDEDEEDE